MITTIIIKIIIKSISIIMIISLSIIIMIKNNNNNNNSKNRQTTQILIDGSKQIACGINLLEVGLLGHTFNPSPVDSDSSPS